jgi:hypothetical protein
MNSTCIYNYMHVYIGHELFVHSLLFMFPYTCFPPGVTVTDMSVFVVCVSFHGCYRDIINLYVQQTQLSCY